MTKIIGISNSHDASVTYLEDGRVVAAVQEERFTNVKNDFGFPYNACQWLIREYGITNPDLIVYAGERTNPDIAYLRREANYSLQDWIKEQHEYWKPLLFEGRTPSLYEIFKDSEKFKFDTYFNYEGFLGKYQDKEAHYRFQSERARFAAEVFGVPADRVIFVPHEKCHQFYALCSGPLHDQDVAMVTAEGMGDYSNETVCVKRGRSVEEISSGLENRLATLYRYVTLILGMKPNEHEYKVMGLAPFAKMYDVEKVLPIFRELMHVDGLNVKWKNQPKDLYFTMKDRLEGVRFDHIAGALQLYLEEMLQEWFRNIARTTGMRKFVFSGGLAQNIKACKSIAEIDEVDDLFICPASGDTSLSVGAAYYAYATGAFPGGGGQWHDTVPFENAYLGHSFSNEECLEAIEKAGLRGRFRIIEDADNVLVAKLLAGGMVLARFRGRMEFGMRALGNRSIIADPRDFSTLKKINDQIKKRDFWMPFTPSMLDSYAERYIVNPKGLKSPFMTMAFDTTPQGRKDLPAAIHPADYTARPQIVTAKANPSYHDLLSRFAAETGVGALLNTSFNLSGYPIVGTPAQAIWTFENSGLDGVLLEDTLVLRH
ncbi:MAG: carbamoyltransferase C-terminal domain-containing protein [Desulfovibrionaceae bacterium]